MQIDITDMKAHLVMLPHDSFLDQSSHVSHQKDYTSEWIVHAPGLVQSDTLE